MDIEVKYSRSKSSADVLLAHENVQVQGAPEGGLTVLTTCVFIVGVIAGSGFLTLPKAIDNAGWIGFVLIFVCCFTSAYTGHILGKCWTIVLEKRSEFRLGKIRYPYPAIGEEAYGKIGRYVVSFSVNFTQFGATVVYVLLAAENIVKLLPEGSAFNCCYVALIVGAIMTPFTWLGTPKEFWGIAALATLTTGITSIVLFGAILHHGSVVGQRDVTHSNVDVISFFSAYGLMCSAYNGHACFPTFQSDMKNPRHFGRALIVGYLIVLFMYTPSSAAGYFIYGEAVKANMLNTLPQGVTTTIISTLMTSHLLFGIVICINPVSQEAEHVFNVPEKFTWKRLVSRTAMMAAVVFVAISVPHFSSILSLVGGSTISILAFVCPPLFYIKLSKAEYLGTERYISLTTKVLLYEIVLIGVTAGVATTYSAVTDLAVNKFTVPCYVDPFKACPN